MSSVQQGRGQQSRYGQGTSQFGERASEHLTAPLLGGQDAQFRDAQIQDSRAPSPFANEKYPRLVTERNGLTPDYVREILPA